MAKLANLEISEAEEEKYSDQLSRILDYIDQLNAVDTENAEATYNTSGLSNVWSGDEVKESLPQEEAIKNSPSTKNGYFVTKGVFEDE